MTHQLFPFLSSVPTSKFSFTDSGFTAPLFQIFFSPLASRRGNSLNFLLFFFGLFFCTLHAFGGVACSLLFYFIFLSHYPHFACTLSFHLFFQRFSCHSYNPYEIIFFSFRPPPQHLACLYREIHSFGLCILYREISICCAGIG
jgi:hypothetical protein